MKATSHEQLLDKYVGKTGTPERDVFETKLAADVQEYLIGEAIREARKRQNLFQFLNPGLLGTFDSFMNKLVSPFMLRRTKAEVIEELPEKTEITRNVSLTDAEITAYETLREATEQALQSEEKVDVNVLAQITKLRQAACAISLIEKGWKMGSTKIAAAVDLVEEIVRSRNNILVFSQLTSFLSMAKTAIEQQATDRAYRIGQNKNVTVFHLIAQHTIEEKIVRLHKTKRDLADSLLLVSNISRAMTIDDLRYLVEEGESHE